MRILTFILLFIIVSSCEGTTKINTSHNPAKPEIKQENNESNEKNMGLLSGLYTGDNLGAEMTKYCQKIDNKFEQYGWGKSECGKYDWSWVRKSYWGNLIPWIVFGEPESEKANTTIIFCGVHGDEITPVKFCFDIMKHLSVNQNKFIGNRIIVAPLVTPDSFLKKYPSRTNAKGIDVNRNFPTIDWDKDAIRLWKQKYSSDKRRFPGHQSKTEQEVHFQINLINRYNPSKIISVHAPLTIIDYDGPSKNHSGEDHEGKNLLVQMSKKADGYKVKNYPFFPGSLGNWAGNERGIPTYTVELPTSDNRQHEKYWKKFESAITHAITHRLELGEMVNN